MREQEEEKEEEAAAALQTVCHIISNAPFQKIMGHSLTKYSKCLCTKGKLPFPELTLLWLMLPNIPSKEKHLKKRKRRREPKKKKVMEVWARIICLAIIRFSLCDEICFYREN